MTTKLPARIVRACDIAEQPTSERCHVAELWNTPLDPEVSIARARVEPGVTTAWHVLDGIAERYLIVEGTGRVEVEGLEQPSVVRPGDIVVIPANFKQRISNIGSGNLVFYCICNPRFSRSKYRQLEA